MKRCTVCKVEKSLDNFYANRRSADGKGYRCKACDDAARKASRHKSEGTRAGYRRRDLKTKYGITMEDYDAMLSSQGNVCAICGTDNPAGDGNKLRGKMTDKSFSVDHCHNSGMVRGLLCNTCNRGLGFFKDSLDLLQKAFKYLECH